MDKQELQERLQTGIQNMINESQREYSRNGSLPGYTRKRFFALSVALLNSVITYKAFSYYLDRYAPSPDGSEPSIDKLVVYISRLKDADKNAVFERINNYFKDKYTVIYLLKNGLEEWLRLRSVLTLPEVFSEELLPTADMRSYYAAYLSQHQKSVMSDHSCDVFDCYSETVNLINKGTDDVLHVYREALRSDFFRPEFSIRNQNKNSAISPDVSFAYHTQKYSAIPVALEVDLGTEAVSTVLAEKCRNYMSYSLSRTAADGTAPLAAIISCRYDSEQEVSVKGTLSAALPFSPEETRFVRSPSWLRIIQLLSIIGYDDYRSFDLSVADVLERLRKDRDMDVEAFAGKEAVRLADMIFSIGVKYANFYKKTMTVPEAYALAERLNGESRQSFFAKRKDGLCGRAQRVSSILNDTFSADSTMLASDAFRGGFSLCAVPDGSLSCAMKSLLPYVCGMDCVKAFLSAAGLSENTNFFCPVYPLVHAGNEYTGWVRNMFRSSGVTVCFEDIGYDIGAPERIHEYLRIPSDFGLNSLMVIIVNDDLTTATGVNLTELVGPNDYAPAGYMTAFTEGYGKKGTLPLLCRKTVDFCFIKRSEFLSADPSSMHPFVLFGKTAFLNRSAAGRGEADKVQVMSYRLGQTVNGTRSITKEFQTYKKN